MELELSRKPPFPVYEGTAHALRPPTRAVSHQRNWGYWPIRSNLANSNRGVDPASGAVERHQSGAGPAAEGGRDGQTSLTYPVPRGKARETPGVHLVPVQRAWKRHREFARSRQKERATEREQGRHPERRERVWRSGPGQEEDRGPWVRRESKGWRRRAQFRCASA